MTYTWKNMHASFEQSFREPLTISLRKTIKPTRSSMASARIKKT